MTKKFPCKHCPTYNPTSICECSELQNYNHYQQGRADVLKELWNIAISNYDEILSLEELNECIEQLKEQN